MRLGAGHRAAAYFVLATAWSLVAASRVGCAGQRGRESDDRASLDAPVEALCGDLPRSALRAGPS